MRGIFMKNSPGFRAAVPAINDFSSFARFKILNAESVWNDLHANGDLSDTSLSPISLASSEIVQ